MKNRRILGIARLLLAIMLITVIFNRAFLSPYLIKSLLRWTGLFGLGLHGLLITKHNLQPFAVTLCNLFIYRGIARFYTNDVTQGFGPEFLGPKFVAGGKISEAFRADGTAPIFF